jgi:hypothetical protein
VRQPILLGLLAGGVMLAACGEAPSEAPKSSPVTTVVNVPVAARETASLPEEFRELAKLAATNGKDAEYSLYRYRYATTGDRAAAIFVPRPIPRDDSALVGAISDIVRRVYNADLTKVRPALEARPQGNVIAFNAPRHSYYVLTVKNETREGEYGPAEPHTFMVWRETRRRGK